MRPHRYCWCRRRYLVTFPDKSSASGACSGTCGLGCSVSGHATKPEAATGVLGLGVDTDAFQRASRSSRDGGAMGFLLWPVVPPSQSR